MSNYPTLARIKREAAVLCTSMVLLAGGCGENESEQQQQGGEREPQAKPVQAAEATVRPLQDRVSGIGDFESPERIEIQPEVSALVVGIDFIEGERVQEGDRLFRLDSETLSKDLEAARAQLESEEALLEEARQAFARQKELYEADVAAEARYEEAQAQIETARARVRAQEARIASLEAQLAEYIISAPFSGIAAEIEVDPGDYVQAGEDLVTLVRTDPLELTFFLPERAAPKISEGQRITATAGALPEDSFEGDISFVSPVVDPETRTFLVKALIGNPGGTLKPGMFATAEAVIGMVEGNPVIPEQSLVGSPGGYQVFTIGENDKVNLVNVEVGIRETGQVEITTGLEPSQRIVSGGVLGLAENDKVTIEELQTIEENADRQRELVRKSSSGEGSGQ